MKANWCCVLVCVWFADVYGFGSERSGLEIVSCLPYFVLSWPGKVLAVGVHVVSLNRVSAAY